MILAFARISDCPRIIGGDHVWCAMRGVWPRRVSRRSAHASLILLRAMKGSSTLHVHDGSRSFPPASIPVPHGSRIRAARWDDGVEGWSIRASPPTRNGLVPTDPLIIGRRPPHERGPEESRACSTTTLHTCSFPPIARPAALPGRRVLACAAAGYRSRWISHPAPYDTTKLNWTCMLLVVLRWRAAPYVHRPALLRLLFHDESATRAPRLSFHGRKRAVRRSNHPFVGLCASPSSR
jgi:hypothetical protein